MFVEKSCQVKIKNTAFVENCGKHCELCISCQNLSKIFVEKWFIRG